MDQFLESLGIPSGDIPKVLSSVVLVLVVFGIGRLVGRSVGRRIDDPEILYRTRKGIAFGSALFVVCGLAIIWVPTVPGVYNFIGITAAGMVIALSDVIVNLAGWLFILMRHPIRVGDRIQIGETSGDVIDTRLLRFTVLEIGNWVQGDQSTGRIIHVPNGRVFRESVANYTDGFEYIWHEIGVNITFESDWEFAEQELLTILHKQADSDNAMPPESALREAARKYLIRFRHLKPIVYIQVTRTGILLSGRLLVNARHRRSVDDSMWRDVLRLVAATDKVTLAYPTNRTLLSTMRHPHWQENQPDTEPTS